MPQIQRLVNVRRGRVLAARIHPADTFSKRFKGLCLRRKFPVGEALWLSPCRSIHTLGMRFPIDALFLDDRLRVIDVREQIAPGRLVRPVPRASSVVELPAGTVKSTGTEIGDQLLVEPMTTMKPSAAPRPRDEDRLGPDAWWIERN
jgi:uncharacterized membrane protein (UPF0127 family)